jgi:RNA polymerase sigma-70 factor (ECF subfamily)
MQRALVELARDGDLEAFSQLAKAAFPRLGGVANLILRDRDAAQDAVQDALFMAWRGLRALRDPDAWDAWLNRVTVRACYKHARKERRRIRSEMNMIGDLRPTDTQDTSADLADRDWLGRELDRLDIEQRTVLVLHYHLDLPVSEVAEILDIPYGTAASRLHRGLEAMRTSMGSGEEAASHSARKRPT